MYIKKEEHTQKFFTNNYIKKWRINQLQGLNLCQKKYIWKEKLNMKKIDEPEFIVSSEELRRNRERALLKDEQIKEEKDEKNTLITLLILGAIIVILIIKILVAMSDRAVESCINGGNSESFCNAHLRG